jgi:hypothetical protein
MSYVSIVAKIKSKLEAITQVKEVWDFPINAFKAEIKDWPIAVIVESSNESDYLTTSENFIVYAYEIWLFNRVDNAILKKEWEKHREVMDAVLDAFHKDPTLGGTVINIKPVPGEWRTEGLSESQSAIMSYVVLRCELDKAFL